MSLTITIPSLRRVAPRRRDIRLGSVEHRHETWSRGTTWSSGLRRGACDDGPEYRACNRAVSFRAGEGVRAGGPGRAVACRSAVAPRCATDPADRARGAHSPAVPRDRGGPPGGGGGGGGGPTRTPR